MQFNVPRKQFAQALSFIPSIVEKKTALPVLSHCLLKAAKDKIIIVGTDLDIVISEECHAEVQVEGSLCVPGGLLHDIVKHLEGYDTLSFTLEDQLFLRCGRAEFRLSTLPAEQFPDVSQLPLTTQFAVDPIAFKKLIDESRLCMVDEGKEALLNSLYLHTAKDNALYSVSTDWHQLALSRMSLDAKPDLHEGVLVGRKAIMEIRRLLDDGAKQVIFGVSNARIQCDIVTDNLAVMLTARQVDGLYPDYTRVIKIESKKPIVFKKIDLQNALERMAVVVDFKFKCVMLDFKTDRMTMTASSMDSGTGKEELEIKFDGTPFETLVNVFYLLTMVRQIETEQVEMYVNGADDAVHLRPLGLAYPHYMVMPFIE